MKHPKPDSHTHARTCTRRLSACCRHPAEPVTGICASCLRERLYGLDSSADPSFSPSTVISTITAAAAAAGSLSPELRRCRSVSNPKCEASCSYEEPRRKSCDVRGRNTLADLFGVDDGGENGPSGSARVESKKLGFSKLSYKLIEPINESQNGDLIRALGDTLSRNVALIGNEDEDDNVDEGEVKTMKEYIDLEVNCKDQKSNNGKNLWEAASVFSKKLRKWRHKQKDKKLDSRNGSSLGGDNGELNPQKLGESQGEVVDYAIGRRSCDTEPRYSVDAGRISVDGSRISFDEPRASWDGYMIARTIPRLAPMLSVVESGILGNGNGFESHRLSVDGHMQSIVEDESSSGLSGQSNSDSSSSQRRSSFDRSSSVRSFSKKTLGLDSDEAKSISNVKRSPAKLVITERELKDWRLKSSKDENSEKFEPECKNPASVELDGNLNGPKKAAPKWRKMFNVFGLKAKPGHKKCESLAGLSMDNLLADGCEKPRWESGEKLNEVSGSKITRSGSVANARKSFDMIGLSRSTRNGSDVKDASGWKLSRTGSIASSRKSIDFGGFSHGMKSGGEVKEACGWKLTRSGSVASSRRSLDIMGLNHDTRSVAKVNTGSADKGGEDFVLELNECGKRSSCKEDDDVLPFYLTPLRSSRSSKSGRHRPQNSFSLNGNILQLN